MAGIYKSDEGERKLTEIYKAGLAAWPVACEFLHLPTSLGETFVVACGDKQAPPLLLLHGSGANALAWLGDVAVWSAHFRVFAVDITGEPGLSAPSRPPLASDKYAQWLGEVMDALSLTSADMAGVSLGGWLALNFATRYPERVARLALLCPGGVGRQKMGFLFKAIFLLMLGDRGRRKALALALGDELAKTNPEVSAYLLTIFKEFKPRTSKLPIFTDKMLRRLAMPVLLIVGGRDAILDSDETLHRLKRAVPRLEAHYQENAGHFLPGQTGTILDFLRAGAEDECYSKYCGALRMKLRS
jgi:pimeloyl-ACP methyl ester carboxylesterase